MLATRNYAFLPVRSLNNVLKALWPVISEALGSRLNVTQIHRIYFTCPSGKETLDNI